MADREGLIFKFFDKWKRKRLNRFAKQLVKDDPSIEKNLDNLGKAFSDLESKLKKKYPDAYKKAMGK
jgi:hypothetical protein|tara:strand:- start:1647 stop:1847 length:201 start_codon:yes stop_codon:yes gene_type:complete